MLKNVCVAAAMAAAMSVPALAGNECGPTPIPPVFPAIAEVTAKPIDAGRQAVVDAYHQVKVYQSALQSFRSCLTITSKKDGAELAEAQGKNEDAKVKRLQDEMADMQALYDGTLAGEQQMASEFNALRMAHCGRGDTNPKICPPAKK